MEAFSYYEVLRRYNSVWKRSNSLIYFGTGVILLSVLHYKYLLRGAEKTVFTVLFKVLFTVTVSVFKITISKKVDAWVLVAQDVPLCPIDRLGEPKPLHLRA